MPIMVYLREQDKRQRKTYTVTGEMLVKFLMMRLRIAIQVGSLDHQTKQDCHPSLSVRTMQGGGGAVTVSKTNVFLVSVDVCSVQNNKTQARVIPAIPSHYKTFAMMKLPDDIDPFYLKTNNLISLPYTNILSAQRAGYAGVLIFFFDFYPFPFWGSWSVPQCTTLHQKSEEISEQIYIPVLIGSYEQDVSQHWCAGRCTK